MKPKFYDNPEISGKRINENLWFKQQQPLLLWMANQKYGRDLLCIDKHFPKIIQISKKHVTGHLDYEKIGKDSYLHWKKSDIRIGAKWANVIRYRWKEFQEYAQEYYRLKEPFLRKYPVLFPVVPQLGFAYTVSTYFPDPDAETTTVDGRVSRDAGVDTFTNVRGGAGTAFSDSAASSSIRIQSSATTDRYEELVVGINLFDSGGGAGANDSPGIPDTDTISATTTSYFGTGTKINQLSQSMVLTNANPASNTALASADYQARINTPTMGTELGTGRITITNWSDTAYNEFTITSPDTNVSKTGLTKLGIRVSADFDNVEPTWAASNNGLVSYINAETAGTSTDPTLVVTHAGAAAAVAVANHFLLMGV